MCGSVFQKHEATGKIVNMNGFHNSLSTLTDIEVVTALNTLTDIEFVTAITAIDLNGETIIGFFHEALWFRESMKHLLLPPIQLWDHRVTVDPVPKQYINGKSL